MNMNMNITMNAYNLQDSFKNMTYNSSSVSFDYEVWHKVLFGFFIFPIILVKNLDKIEF